MISVQGCLFAPVPKRRNYMTHKKYPRSQKQYSPAQRIVCAVLVALIAGHPAVAGTQGSYINSAGFGRAVDAIQSGATTWTATSPYMQYPNAAVNPASTADWTAWVLPRIASSSIHCQSRGFPNFIWQVSAYVTGSFVADNEFLEGEVDVDPTDCPAEILVTTQGLNPNGTSMQKVPPVPGQLGGSILLNGTISDAAAIGLRGVEYTGEAPEPDLEELLNHPDSKLLFKYVLKGPANYGQEGDTCEGLRIPFTTKTGIENFYLIVDTLAKGNPLKVVCPADVSFECNQEVVYPVPEIVGGCLEQGYYVAYDPPVELLPPGETLVKASLFYQDGSPLTHPPTVEGGDPVPVECEFKVTRLTTEFSGFYPPLNGTGGDCKSPILVEKRGRVIPVKFQLLCHGTPSVGGPAPRMVIRSCAGGHVIEDGKFQAVPPEWHFNWDTSGLATGVYELSAILPDGTKKSTFVRLR
jgi:hypothetical protein